MGGSITAGAGSYDAPTDAWVDRLQAFLTKAYSRRGVNVTVNNGAVPGARWGLLGWVLQAAGVLAPSKAEKE